MRISKLYRWMQVTLLCELLVLAGCTSNQFHSILTMVQSGADYIALVSGHPEIEPAINALVTETGACYDGWVAGTSTATKVQGCITNLGSGLTTIFNGFKITDSKTIGLVQLTIGEVTSLIQLIPLAQPATLHKAMKMPSEAQAKVASPQFRTPSEFKSAFNLIAGVKVIK
jgi:hypothetical protein